MKKIISVTLLSASAITMSGCLDGDTSTSRESRAVARQQDQYSKGQPPATFDYSLERELVNQLYRIRNANVLTHSVWRADYGMIINDCPSMGYGIPYDVSLTNPLVATDISQMGNEHYSSARGSSLTSIEQPEPNGVFASKNTNATWVMCIGDVGNLDPIYIEAKVNVYPYSLDVNYETNRVTKKGKSRVSISKQSLLTKGMTTQLNLKSE